MTSGPLQVTSAPREIFSAVLRSLESHRPTKAERDVLDVLQQKFGLPVDRATWPDVLSSRVAVSEFLAATLNELSPFVEMLVELYSFLCRQAATSGGRSDHFAIDAEGLSQRWQFDTSKLPHEERWVSFWRNLQIEELDINWNTLNQLLLVDNGVFYGGVEGKRLVQSLIVARRDNEITDEVREIGDRLFGELRRVVRAWFASLAEERAPLLHLYLPTIVELLGGSRDDGAYWIPADVRRLALVEPPWALEDVLGTTAVKRADNRNYGLQGAAVFCALWGLEDDAFRAAAHRLGSRDNLLLGRELRDAAPRLWAELSKLLRSAIRPTGRTIDMRLLDQQRLEILLLPYWKDRWFLYELWTLLQTFRVGEGVGARVELRNVHELSQGQKGKVWHLPTQKAREPVAVLHSRERRLLVWFQRETIRRDATTHMEPDVRVTRHDRDEDLLIIECKDRLAFGPTAAQRLAERYRAGSDASLVWLVNYEQGGKAGSQPQRSADLALGWVAGFKPHAIPRVFDRSLADAFTKELLLPAPAGAASQAIWVLDTSGSMASASLSDIRALAEHLAAGGALWRWADDVQAADSETRAAAANGRVARANGVEAAEALTDFVSRLPPGAEVTVVTDSDGREHLRSKSAPSREGDDTFVVSGRRLKTISVS